MELYHTLNIVAENEELKRFRASFTTNGKRQIQVENSQNRKGADKNCSKQFLMDITGKKV